jgi:hypothetical protein
VTAATGINDVPPGQPVITPMGVMPWTTMAILRTCRGRCTDTPRRSGSEASSDSPWSFTCWQRS